MYQPDKKCDILSNSIRFKRGTPFGNYQMNTNFLFTGNLIWNTNTAKNYGQEVDKVTTEESWRKDSLSLWYRYIIYRLQGTGKKYGYEIQRATSFWVSPSWMHNFLPSFDKVTDKGIGTDLTIFKRGTPFKSDAVWQNIAFFVWLVHILIEFLKNNNL